MPRRSRSERSGSVTCSPTCPSPRPRLPWSRDERMITGDEYRASLRDGRAVWLEGARVADVPDDLVLGKSVDWVASTYDEYAGRDNPMYSIPRTQQDLRAQMDFLLRSDRTAASTAGCIALATVGDERLQAYVEGVRVRDMRVAAA